MSSSTDRGRTVRHMENLILTGFMGTGKSTVGREVARRLGRAFIDMDHLIEQRAGRSIARIFAEEGEGTFRAMEAQLCRELSQARGLVIATGGGTLVDPENRRIMMQNAMVVCLEADVETILARVGRRDDRPLLRGADRRAKIKRLMAQRREAYAAIPWHVQTSGRTQKEIVDEILCLSRGRTLLVSYPGGSYEAHLGRGILRYLGGVLRAAGVSRGSRVAIVSNDTVAPFYGEEVKVALRSDDLVPTLHVIPDGEAHKHLDTVRMLYEAFVGAGLDRHGVVLGLGGGVVGDVAGFAAATYMRGVRYVQVPTTLLAMTDASVGGKTGVDLPAGKNLVGAFKQPLLVFIDLETLRTLPGSELRSGLAEVLKHGVIGDPQLFEALEAVDRDRVQQAMTPDLLARSIQVKIRVVQQDPFEKGLRAVLNLGHTTGHALEKLSGYTMRHGDAVAIGMVVATRIAQAQGRTSSALCERLEAALDHLGLPVMCPPWPVEGILAAMKHDKKRRGNRLRWILPRDVGEVVIADDVPEEIVRSVLVEMGARG